MYGRSVLGSVTMVMMLPVIALPLRFTSAALSFKARPRIGARRANEGASIECINSHSKRASRASLVLLAAQYNRNCLKKYDPGVM